MPASAQLLHLAWDKQQSVQLLHLAWDKQQSVQLEVQGLVGSHALVMT